MTKHILATLPVNLRYRLLTASCGKHHLLETARLAMAEAGRNPDSAETLLVLAKELFTSAWLEDPLDGTIAIDLAEFEKRLPTLSAAGSKCVTRTAAICAQCHDKVILSKLSRREQGGEYEPLSTWLKGELRLSPANGFLAWTLYHHALDNADFATGIEVAANLTKISPMGPAIAKLSADAHFLAGNYKEAITHYKNVELAFPDMCAERIGETHYRMNNTKDAISNLKRAATATPWKVNAVLRLYDISEGVDQKLEDLTGKTAILLYSFNNAEKLNSTLQSLHSSLESSDSETLIRVLSNGCTDKTNEVIAKWAETFGDQYEGVILPVNVGAPAARNWLASLPEVRECDFVTYLDDDVRLPADWLRRLGAAVALYPNAGVWGCKVSDYERTTNLQQVDLNLLPPTEGETLFSMSEAHLSAHDFGQFSYLRPSSSVTGCCHLFRTQSLLKSGEFDIRFSPTQYDDLDHDLRLGLSGEPIVYQGHLSVEHMKISGRLAAQNKASLASATGNMLKLKGKYSSNEMDTLRQQALENLEEDLARKLEKLGN
ncbi:glycosyltransferase [Maridesulfovibrio frigidus]|uniref:glycosyltransferase n=1 Tax=Maridesulfovibrio frigidus TaxID=340956 RepID=UPI0004E0BC97|nr:glycosyltransferase [Maridesulfovibrio frigidus]